LRAYILAVSFLMTVPEIRGFVRVMIVVMTATENARGMIRDLIADMIRVVGMMGLVVEMQPTKVQLIKYKNEKIEI